jgi:hypothetical protein
MQKISGNHVKFMNHPFCLFVFKAQVSNELRIKLRERLFDVIIKDFGWENYNH